MQTAYGQPARFFYAKSELKFRFWRASKRVPCFLRGLCGATRFCLVSAGKGGYADLVALAGKPNFG